MSFSRILPSGGSRSSFVFPAKLRCFDPVATLRRAAVLLLAIAAALYVLPSSVYVAAAALSVAVCASLLLSRADRKRFSCTVVRLEGCRLMEIEERRDGLHGVLLVDGGSVAGLRSRMRLVTERGVAHGMRRLPVVLQGRGATVRWQDGDVDVPLEEDDEITGAIGVVSCGRDVSLEVVYGSRVGERARVLAARFSSSEGAVQSWETELLSVQSARVEFRGFLQRGVLARVLARRGAVEGAEVASEK